MRILVVEDEAIVRFYLKVTLSNISGEVVDTKGGEEALTLLETDSDFDLIITDIKMSGMDGFDFIDELDRRGFQDMPIVVESAYLTDDPRMYKYKSRVKAFIKKPIDLNVLESVIRQIENELNHPH